MTAMPGPQATQEIVWGTFVSGFSSVRSTRAQEAMIEPERAHNTRSQHCHNIYRASACQIASIESP